MRVSTSVLVIMADQKKLSPQEQLWVAMCYVEGLIADKQRTGGSRLRLRHALELLDQEYRANYGNTPPYE